MGAYFYAVMHKKRIWPEFLYRRYTNAKMEMLSLNRIYKKEKPYYIQRYLLEKQGTHYDIYEHEFKRI